MDFIKYSRRLREVLMLALETVSTGRPETTDAVILLIQSEAAMADSIKYFLEHEGLGIVEAADGENAIERFRAVRPGLVILDLMLPKVSGLDLCRAMRLESTVPILILTAKDSEADKVAGLEIGADDYMTKPFSMRELVARIRAQLRRAGMMEWAESPDADPAPVHLDSDRHLVWVRRRSVELPLKEFNLLEVLLRAEGRLRTRASLIDEVWGPHYVGDTKTLDVHVKRLRQKIELDPHNPKHLVTVRGVGYKFINDPGGSATSRKADLSPQANLIQAVNLT
jgi:two-component system response regulator RegX3